MKRLLALCALGAAISLSGGAFAQSPVKGVAPSLPSTGLTPGGALPGSQPGSPGDPSPGTPPAADDADGVKFGPDGKLRSRFSLPLDGSTSLYVDGTYESTEPGTINEDAAARGSVGLKFKF